MKPACLNNSNTDKFLNILASSGIKQKSYIQMKLLVCSVVIALFLASCHETSDKDVVCTIEKQSITLRNANTAISVDNNIKFGISFKNQNITTNDGQKGNASVRLRDSVNNIVSFTRKSARLEEINNKYGEGKKIIIDALSGDQCILCTVSLTSYNQIPDAIIVQASFKNISGRNYLTLGYTLNNINLPLPSGEVKWWTFQGASYQWGQDFAFQLPESYKRENYMGLNTIREGSGIPLTDIWNKNYGLALACLSDKPEDISLPVEAEQGKVQMKVKGKAKEQTLLPGDSLITIQTAIIVHTGDFYDPLRTFSGLMKPFLPDFQKPVDYAYQTEWCTWGYNQNFTPEEILGKLDHLQDLEIKSVIIDDGWSVNHGDWIPDPLKFPAGDDDFKSMINKIHEKGFKVWLWWIPGYADSKSSVAASHPDWLIKNKDGSVHPSYGFCSAYPPVQEHYKNLVQKFVEEYKLDGFKLDFREINSAPPCYNQEHHHQDPFESYSDTPVLFKNIFEAAKRYNPQMLIEYCSCGIPPNIFHLPWTNLAVTSDPDISQITNRIKMYKALRGDDFPVLEEYCGVLAGPIYQLTIGTGGVPGTFSTYLDEYHEKWQKIYQKYQLSRGQYLNLYDIGFDYPEAHVIKKDDSFYYSFYTHPWNTLETRRLSRFGTEFDFNTEGKTEVDFPGETFSGNLEFRGLDAKKKYIIIDYEKDLELGIIQGNKPNFNVSFLNYLLLKLTLSE